MIPDHITIIGAGAVGRGLIAPMFAKRGTLVSVIDSNVPLMDAIKQRRYVPVSNGDGELRWYGPLVPLKYNTSAVPVFVCVRIENLLPVGKNVLSNTVYFNKPCNVVVVENTPNAAGKLAEMAGGSQINFVNAIAECIIPDPPPAIKNADPLYTIGDPNGYLIIDAGAWQGERFDVDGVVWSNNFARDWDCKWYLHCALHCIVAVLGLSVGYTFIHEAIIDKEIRATTLDIMHDVLAALREKHGVLFGARLEREFGNLDNPMRPDRCTRVARDLKRKLEQGERLMDTLALLGGQHSTLENVIGIAKGLTNEQ